MGWKRMKRYTVHLQGSTFEKVVFAIAFTLACFTIILLPVAILTLIQRLEVIEDSL